MIRVPIEPNRVGFAATTDARFQAADYSGTGLQALGHGLEQLGEAGERFAQVQQQVQDRFNDAGAKAIDGDATTERLTLLSDYQNKKGHDAEQAFPLVQQALAEITKRSEARATTKTVREMLANVNVERDRLAHADFLKHYQDQSQVAAVASAGARRDVSIEAAVRAIDPLDREQNVATGEGEVRTLGQLRGDPPEVVENDVRKYHSGVLFAIGRKLALAGDLDAAAAHLDQHASGLLDADEFKLREMLAEPLRQRDVEAHVDRRMGAATRTGDAPFSYSNPLHGAGRAPVLGATGGGITLPAPAGTTVFASGPGIARISQDETGGNILTVDHGNGRTTRYLALGQLAVSDGDHVTPDTPIGRVGDGGTGTPHLRYEIIDNGTPVSPDAVLADVRRSPRRLNLDATLADIDRDPSLNDDMREDAKIAARRRAKLGNDLADHEEEAARSRVYDLIDTLPDQRLTTTAQIPPDLWSDLTEADRARLKSEIRANNLGTEVAKHGEVVADLNQLLWRDPGAFAKQDLRLVRSAMTPREYAALATLQSQLRANPAAPQVAAHKRIWDKIARDGPALGVDPADPATRQRAQAISTAMATDLEAETGGRRLPSDEELTASFDRQTEVVVVAGPHTVEDARSLSPDRFASLHEIAKAMGLDTAQENQAIHDYVHGQRSNDGDVAASAASPSGHDHSATSRSEGDKLLIPADRRPAPVPKDTRYDFSAFVGRSSSPSTVAIAREATLNRRYTDGYRDYLSKDALRNNAIGTFVSNPSPPSLRVNGLREYSALVDGLSNGPASGLVATGALVACYSAAGQQRVADLVAPLDGPLLARAAIKLERRAGPATTEGHGGAVIQLKPSAAVRAWYSNEVRTLDTSGPLTRANAEQVHETRNALKQQARDLKQQARDMMADRDAAKQLTTKSPIRPFSYYIDKYFALGYRDEKLWERIIEGGITPNAKVDKRFGV